MIKNIFSPVYVSGEKWYFLLVGSFLCVDVCGCEKVKGAFLLENEGEDRM